jgi:hypothetical protein
VKRRYRTIHYGIGAIGAEIVRVAAQRPEIEIVGAIDSDPAKAGHDLSHAAGLRRPLRLTISDDAAKILSSVQADVVLHSTGSHLDEVLPQIRAVVRAGKNVLSTCEELSYPWERHPQLSADLDRAAKERGITVVGTGVNPGFVLDSLVLALALTCQQVSRVSATRVVDVGTRRVQLQRKVGAGLDVKDFGQVSGHIGLRESACMIADRLGWGCEGVEETLEPVVSPSDQRTAHLSVKQGQVAGVHQVVRLQRDGREVLRLDLTMAVGTPHPRDEIEIEGTPPLHSLIERGIQGDAATAAIAVNAVPPVVAAAPGLLTMADLPLTPPPGLTASPGGARR